ncbi:hypothetical protein BJ742DRAFT_873268 [Cladochytrium replicatum]|nr:hypothetical protein BJ742DRAFT_873268 [Cladochytrium replicatum]
MSAGLTAPVRAEDIPLFTNSIVHPEPNHLLYVTLYLANGNTLYLRGFFSPASPEELKVPGGQSKGIDFAYSFVAKAVKLEDGVSPLQRRAQEQITAEWEGAWKGSLQFSRFRWALRTLSKAGEDEYAAVAQAYDKAMAVETDKHKAHAVIEEGKSLSSSGKHREAVASFTRASSFLPIFSGNDDEEEEEDIIAMRLQIHAHRSASTYAIQAYRSSARDCEMLEREYSRPVDLLNSLETGAVKIEEARLYFSVMFRRGQCFEKLGRLEVAAQVYLQTMVIKAMSEDRESTTPKQKKRVKQQQQQQDSAAVGDNVAAQASEAIKTLAIDPNTYLVTGDTYLTEAREFILTSVGWCGDKVHEWILEDHGAVRFTLIPEDAGYDLSDPLADTYDAYEDEMFREVGERATFLYESGVWAHDVEVVAIRPEILKGGDDEFEEEVMRKAGKGGSGDPKLDLVEEAARNMPAYPRCVAGARACPPQDLGGPSGYEAFIKVASGQGGSEKFRSRTEALEFAMANIGYTNDALDSWGGIQGRAKLAVKGARRSSQAGGGAGDANVGGWSPDAFNIDDINDALRTLVGMYEAEDQWEDDEEEEVYTAE